MRLTIEPPGITPACAGKSPCISSGRHTTQDHPRVCGEKSITVLFRSVGTGSPPRVRGKVNTDFYEQFKQRITPACAGKSQRRRRIALVAEDHPRVCGEKVAIICITAFLWGSPPRVRGKVKIQSPLHARCRITPACAGKRCACCLQRLHCKDHPRVCGEKR